MNKHAFCSYQNTCKPASSWNRESDALQSCVQCRFTTNISITSSSPYFHRPGFQCSDPKGLTLAPFLRTAASQFDVVSFRGRRERWFYEVINKIHFICAHKPLFNKVPRNRNESRLIDAGNFRALRALSDKEFLAESYNHLAASYANFSPQSPFVSCRFRWLLSVGNGIESHRRRMWMSGIVGKLASKTPERWSRGISVVRISGRWHISCFLPEKKPRNDMKDGQFLLSF